MSAAAMDESGEDCDNICPLCMEEMDITDRHLKPCQCGYQICVWCWHHVIENAAKDNSEGRCPACRTPYDKDKVVGTRLSCSELELAVEKRKHHKSKSRQEGRKHLSSVRVVQRNLVYIVGFPVHLADEETLEKREYFGQYGKILKVAVSRQHSHNGPSASVYVTFVKEEDAIKCIKAIDGCVFEGKLLRACFGTNKYCNAWLKNMLCNNPECLYLHEEGPDEDSYTKEEMISKYGRKEQFHELTRPPHRAAGVLPSPFEASSSNSLPPPAQTPNKVSVPKPATTPSKVNLPPAAAWGMRGSSGKTAPKVQVPGTKKKVYGGTTGMKAETPLGKEVEEADGSFGTVPAASEREEYTEGTDMKAEVLTDSSQGSLSPETHGRYNLSMDLRQSSPQSSSDRINVGGLSISLNSELSDGQGSEVLSPDRNGGQNRNDSDDVLSALDRIDLNGEDSRPSSSNTDAKQVAAPDEKTIISDILTMDFSTDGALSPEDLKKLCITRKSCRVSDKVSEEFLESPWKSHGKQQSRFSFAREDTSGSSLDGFLSESSSRDFFARSSTSESGHASAMKPRAFAPPPGFSGVPPPGFSLRSTSVPPSPVAPGTRVHEVDLLDPAIMAVGRGGALQNELSRTIRGQPKADIRQLFTPNDSESILGLDLLQQQQQQHGFLEFGSLAKQQNRKMPLEFPYGGDLGRLSGQYDNSYMPPYSPGTRSFRNISSVENSWGAYAENLAKFKRANSMNSRPVEGSTMFYSNGNQALHIGDQSFREADIQGAFV